eukprot:333735_1
MALTENQENAIIIIYIVTSSISLLADCFIIFGYLKFHQLKKLAFTFVFCIALGDVCRSLAQTWGNVGNHNFMCKFQGWLQTIGAVSMGLWFASIAAVCISIKKFSFWWKTKTQKDIKKLEIRLIVSVTVFAFICASIPWNYYSYGGGWCWISSDPTGTLLRYLCYYGWLMVCLFFTIIVYCELFRIIRNENKIIAQEEESEKAQSAEPPSMNSTVSVSSVSSGPAPTTLDTKKKRKRMFDQMKLYPWALIIGQGPGAIRRIIELISNKPAPFIFVVIHAICSGLFGFITAVIYGTKTWQIYKKYFIAIFSNEDNENNNDNNNGQTDTQMSTNISNT